MASGFGWLAIFGIGVTAGLRTMTAPAVVAWAAHLGWINLSGSPLAAIGSIWAVALLTTGALVEYVVDQLPSTPPRTAAAPLTARIVMGLLTGACLGAGAGGPVAVGALVGALGAVSGAFGGYQARIRLVRGLGVKDAMIAIPEDLLAIGLGLLCCFQIMKFRVAAAGQLGSILTHLYARMWS